MRARVLSQVFGRARAAILGQRPRCFQGKRQTQVREWTRLNSIGAAMNTCENGTSKCLCCAAALSIFGTAKWWRDATNQTLPAS